MCVAARVLERYEDRVTPDGTPPFLVFEWIVVEAFARNHRVAERFAAWWSVVP